MLAHCGPAKYVIHSQDKNDDLDRDVQKSNIVGDPQSKVFGNDKKPPITQVKSKVKVLPVGRPTNARQGGSSNVSFF